MEKNKERTTRKQTMKKRNKSQIHRTEKNENDTEGTIRKFRNQKRNESQIDLTNKMKTRQRERKENDKEMKARQTEEKRKIINRK